MRTYQKNQDMRYLSEATALFEELGRFRGSHRMERRIMDMIASNGFLHAVFCPTMDRYNTKEEFTSALSTMYEAATKPNTIRALADVLYDYGTRGCRQTTAVFLTTLVNLSMTDMNGKAVDLGQRRDHKELDEDEYERKLDKLNDYQKHIGEILESAKDIIKRDARELARESGVPRKICQSALYTVPEPQFLDQYKIGFYLNAMLGNLYGFINISDNVEFLDSVSWTRFMSGIFHKSRVTDVASLILLETNERIDSYQQSPRAVGEVIDSLTNWAVITLDRSPDERRDHMIELYLKRLNSILDGQGLHIRFNLNDLDEFNFRNLYRTIRKYGERLNDILSGTSRS